MRYGLLHEKKGTCEVYFNYLSPQLRIDIDYITGRIDPRVVYQHIKPAAEFNCCFDHTLNISIF